MKALSRYPIIPLSIEHKELAKYRELLVDYETGEIFIKREDETIKSTVDSLYTKMNEEGIDTNKLVIDIPGFGKTLIGDLISNLYLNAVRSDGTIGKTESSLSDTNTLSYYTGAVTVNTSDKSSQPNEVIYLLGGKTVNGIASDTIEYFSNGIWKTSPSKLSKAISNASVGAFNNSPILIGGKNTDGSSSNTISYIDKLSSATLTDSISDACLLSSAENKLMLISGEDKSIESDKTYFISHEPKTDSILISTGPVINVARTKASASGVISNGLLIGGRNTVSDLTITEKFNGDTWSIGENLNIAKAELTSAYLHGKYSAAGGSINNGSILNTIEEFDGTKWSTIIGHLEKNRAGATSVIYNNNIEVIGGYNKDSGSIAGLNSCERITLLDSVETSIQKIPKIEDSIADIKNNSFDSTASPENCLIKYPTGVWQTKPECLTSIINGVASGSVMNIDKEFTLVTGQSKELTYLDKSFNFKNNIWSTVNTTTSNKLICSAGVTATLSDQGETEFIIGGKTESGTIATIEKKSSTDGWSLSPLSINIARFGHGAVGKKGILVVGGTDSEETSINSVEKILSDDLAFKVVNSTSGSSIPNSRIALVGTESSALYINSTYNIDRCSEYYNGTIWKTKNATNDNKSINAGGSAEYAIAYGPSVSESFNGMIWKIENISRNYNTYTSSVFGGTNRFTICIGGSDDGGTGKEFEAYIVEKLYNDIIEQNVIDIKNISSTVKTLPDINNLNTITTSLKDNNMLEIGTVVTDVKNTLSEIPIKVEGSWTNKQNLITAKFALAGCGTSGSALSFGGKNGSFLATTEEYNGNVWNNKTDMNTAKSALAGCGVSSSALSFGGYDGYNASTTEEYNGVIWTNKSNMNSAKSKLTGCGINNNALTFGGTKNYSIVPNVELYDGLIWTIKTNMNTIREGLAGCGTSSSALAFGGADTDNDNSIYLDSTEEYNGDIWSNKDAMNIARRDLAGCGTVSNTLSFGGSTADFQIRNTTEKYDGNKWINKSDMNTSREYLAGCGNTGSALSIGGSAVSDSSPLAITELFFETDNIIKIITESVISGGGQIQTGSSNIISDVVIKDKKIEASGWIQDGTLFKYDIISADSTSDDFADVYFKVTDFDIAEFYGILPMVDVLDGKIVLYAKFKPEVDLVVDIKIEK